MPLIRSMTPKVSKANIKAEIEAGKPVKQAVAIGYSVKKEAEKAKKAVPKRNDRYHTRPRKAPSRSPQP
jgi:prefoldin subunit 5